MALRTDQKTLLAAGAASVLLWAVPAFRFVALPLIYLNTHVHELCHALMALATGGRVEHILVFSGGNGVTPVSGGSILLTASAGYVGAAVVGGVLVGGARSEKAAKGVLWAGCVFMALSLLLFVRGDIVGLVSGAFWTAVFGVAAAKLKREAAMFAAGFLGVQMALTSLEALLVLLRLTTVPMVENDALLLQNVTGVPSIVWAAGWSLFGLVAVVSSLAAAWRPASRKARST
ncbi:MAG: M50 family metallopeptidase [Armatimonadetes bacterium]|nr:M50 family metallopeptidase [Armatimonadota bacterium]